jgi:hypothetical protein
VKNYIFHVPGGGVFSRLLQFAILPLADIEFDNVYLIPSGFVESDDPADPFGIAAYKLCQQHVEQMKAYGIDEPYEHIFNYVLDQKKGSGYTYGGYLPMGPTYNKENKIELSSRFQDYKRVLDKIRLKPELYFHSNRFCKENNITEETLGVHVRLTTMNMLHWDLYQQITIDDYIREIKIEFISGKYKNIFVSADNDESISRIRAEFGDNIIAHNNFIRYPTEKHKDFFDSIPEYDWFYQKRYWVETFNDCMVLARCGGLVCRESNFSNMAILLSKGYKKIVRVYA